MRAVRCQSCLRPYVEVEPRPFAQVFYYKSILGIPDADPPPPTEVCDNCYNKVTGNHNPHPAEVPNFLLRNLAK